MSVIYTGFLSICPPHVSIWSPRDKNQSRITSFATTQHKNPWMNVIRLQRLFAETRNHKCFWEKRRLQEITMAPLARSIGLSAHDEWDEIREQLVIVKDGKGLMTLMKRDLLVRPDTPDLHFILPFLYWNLILIHPFQKGEDRKLMSLRKFHPILKCNVKAFAGRVLVCNWPLTATYLWWERDKPSPTLPRHSKSIAKRCDETH